VQRDFTFVSPVPSATGEGLPFLQDMPVRGLLLTIGLNSYWDCTTESTRKRWSVEQPEQKGALGSSRTWSSLADPSVVYELVVERPSNAVEPQVEIAFSAATAPLPANPKASDVYTAKARGKLFAPTITGLIAPTGNVDPFCLVVELQRKSG